MIHKQILSKFTAGDYVTVAPVGIPVILSYNTKGVIDNIFLPDNTEQIYGNFPVDRKCSTKFFDAFYHNKTGCIKIPISGSKTNVYGILYTESLLDLEGELPFDIIDELEYYYIANPSEFKFYAYDVVSNTVLFNSGIHSMRQWLSMTGFNILPGFIVPARITSDSIEQLITQVGSEFKYIIPLTMSYIIYHQGNMSIVDNYLLSCRVTDTCDFVDAYGNLKTTLSTQYKDIVCDYSDTLKYNIQPSSYIVLDKLNNIIFSHFLYKQKLSGTLSCKYCGRQIIVPKSGECKCSNEHCISRLYPQLQRFASTYDLPVLTYDRFLSIRDAEVIRWLADMFYIDEYKDVQIYTTLSKLITAIIPEEVLRGSNIVDRVLQYCNNNINMFNYYVENPNKILKDFKIGDNAAIRRFMKWLEDPENLLLIKTFVDLDNIHISDTDKKFSGAPIFRGKTIMITGKFLHGSTDDIIGILKSYNAEVTLHFSDGVDCILVGSAHEDIDSISIQKAKKLDIPVYEEYSFFEDYDIDRDLKTSLG